MPAYYHCVPGRMRIRIRALKHQPDLGSEVKNQLHGLDGVTGVTYAALTGSVVVLYDPGRIGPDQICECLIDRGLFDVAIAAAPNDPVQDAVTQAGLRIGKAAVGWAVGRALQASGLSLLAALI